MSGLNPPNNTRRAVVGVLVFFTGIQHGFSDTADFASSDTVTLRAERAWESDEADVMYFDGKFEIRAPDWYLTGDSAVVYGALDNPDRVVVEGLPAKLAFIRTGEEQTGEDGGVSSPGKRIDGTAAFIEYFRIGDKLTMRGAASMVSKNSTLVSESIEYDIDTERYSASGEGGINVLLQPGTDQKSE